MNALKSVARTQRVNNDVMDVLSHVQVLVEAAELFAESTFYIFIAKTLSNFK